MCTLWPDGRVRLLVGWWHHKGGKRKDGTFAPSRGPELYVKGGSGGVDARFADPVALTKLLRGLAGSGEAWFDLILAVEEPAGLIQPSHVDAAEHTGLLQMAFEQMATRVPYRTWVRRAGINPSLKADEVRKIAKSEAGHLIGGWDAPAAVLGAAVEAYWIARVALDGVTG